MAAVRMQARRKRFWLCAAVTAVFPGRPRTGLPLSVTLPPGFPELRGRIAARAAEVPQLDARDLHVQLALDGLDGRKVSMRDEGDGLAAAFRATCTTDAVGVGNPCVNRATVPRSTSESPRDLSGLLLGGVALGDPS